jgi:hypothetical protein
VIAVPADTSIKATHRTGVVFTYVASAADSVDGVVDVSCSPASGSTFPLGTTTVICTAADTYGNTNSASFVVTVAYFSLGTRDRSSREEGISEALGMDLGNRLHASQRPVAQSLCRIPTRLAPVGGERRRTCQAKRDQ